MKTFSAFFNYELKRFFCKKNILVMILFLLLALYFVQDGISQYNGIVQNKESFLKIESTKVNHYINYTQYGSYGFRLLFVPSPLSIFFSNSSLISQLTANIDSADVLKIFNSFKGKNIYEEKAGGFKDFSGLILLFGTLMVLFFGYETFSNKEYMKFISGFAGYKQAFIYIQVCRILLILGFFTCVTGLSLLLMTLNGISLNGTEMGYLLRFLGVMYLLLIFLFILGAMAGTSKSRFNGIVAVMAIWFTFVFLIPGAIHKMVARRADNITSLYQLEFEKLKTMMAFEKKALDHSRRYTSIEEKEKGEKVLAAGFLKNEFKKIQTFEKRMQQEMKDNFSYFQNLSMVFPTTFYQSVNNEISSRGYESFFRFYDYVLRLKSEFVLYYADKKYFSDYDKVESFIKGDQNLYYAASWLPGKFVWGLIFTLIYILVSSTLTFRRFRSYLFFVPDREMPELRKLKIRLASGKSEVVLTGDYNLKSQFYNAFSGETQGFIGNLMLDNIDISDNSESIQKDFIYLCHTSVIPDDVRAGEFLTLLEDLMRLSKKEKAELYLKLDLENIEYKTFAELEDLDKGRLLLTAAHIKRSKVIMMDDIARGMPGDFIICLMDALRSFKEKGSAILYLTADTLIVKRVGDSVTSLLDDPKLHKRLKTFRFLSSDVTETLVPDRNRMPS